MANPVAPGTFDNWIADRQGFETGSPKSGNTGSFDIWMTDQSGFADYTEASAAATSIPVFMASYRRRRAA